MNDVLLNNGWYVRWKLPEINFETEYSKLEHFWLLGNLFYAFGKSKATKWVLSFLYKYTHLEEDKLNLFLDRGNIDDIDDLMLPIINSNLAESTSYTTEDGYEIDCICCKLNPEFDYKQRRDFLFLLLKCKYNREQANSILDYYSEITNLDYDELTSELKLYRPDWKEIANKMEYNKDGKVESTFNFISDVILE